MIDRSVSHFMYFFLINVFLDYPPQVDEIQFEPEIEAPIGGSVVLKCAVRGNPTPTIAWSKEGLLVSILLFFKAFTRTS